MRCAMLSRRLFIALVAAWPLLAARPATAQSTTAYYYYTYSYGYNPGYYAHRYPARPIAGPPNKLAPVTMTYLYYAPATTAPSRLPPNTLRMVITQGGRPAATAQSRPKPLR